MSPQRTSAQILAEAEAAVAAISDTELKKLAFEKAIGLASAPPSTVMDSISRLIQVLSVVIGVIVSVLSFNASRQSEAHAREAEAAATELQSKQFLAERSDSEYERRSAAAKPYLELRQKMYIEAAHVAAVLSNPESYSEQELTAAQTRFRELYVAELSLIEGADVEYGMMELAKIVEPELAEFTDAQKAAYQLAHALRNSLAKSWNVEVEIVDNPH